MPLDDYTYYERTHYEYTAFQICYEAVLCRTRAELHHQAPYSEVRPAVRWGESTVPGMSVRPEVRFSKRDPNNAAAPISYNSGSMSPEDKLRTECYPKARETLEAAVPEGKRPENEGQSTNSRISTEAGNAVR